MRPSTGDFRFQYNLLINNLLSFFKIFILIFGIIRYFIRKDPGQPERCFRVIPSTMSEAKRVPKNSVRFQGILFLVLLLSGFSALVCQVVWIRMFGLLFGVTVYAVSTVLTVFMAGLALGSIFFGRLVDRRKDPLKVFVFLELGIGLYAVVFPLIYKGLSTVYVGINTSTQPGPYADTLVRFALSFAALIVPTFLMGGTIPVISKHFAGNLDRLGWNVGRLYSINNCGAVLGCFTAGFFLLRYAGLYRGLMIAAALNIVNAALVFTTSRLPKEAPFSPAAIQVALKNQKPLEQENKAYPPYILRLVLWAFALEGFASLAYEIIWTRVLLASSVDKTVYFTTTIIVTFISGIFLGSMVMARFVDRFRNRLIVFAWLQALVGISMLAALSVSRNVVLFVESFGRNSAGPWWVTMGRESLAFFLLLIIPATLLGMKFPIAARILTLTFEKAGGRIGFINSLDTIGAIAGSFLAGFLMIPYLGMEKALFCIALLNGCIAAGLLLVNPFSSIGKKALFLAIIAGAFCLAFLEAPSRQMFRNWQAAKTGKEDRILYFKEGPGATVAVPQSTEGVMALVINGTATAFTDYSDLRVHRMLGYLPYLLSRDPRRALVVGLGMGVTSQSLIQQDVDEVDCAEICPQVVGATSTIFTRYNGNVVAEPKFHLSIDDGRSYIIRTKKKYDIITSNAIHTRMSINIYTKDYYELCRKKLMENGIMCQWMPTNWMSLWEFKSLLRAFTDVFPFSSLWIINAYHAVLVGSPMPMQVDFKAFSNRLLEPKIAGDLKGLDLDNPYAFLAQFGSCGTDLMKSIGDVPPATDNNPWPEFSRTVDIGLSRDIMNWMIAQTRNMDGYLVNTGNPAENAQVTGEINKYLGAEQSFMRAMWEKSFGKDKNIVIETLENAVRVSPGDYVFLDHLAACYRERGSLEKAAECLNTIVTIHPNSVRDYTHLAMVYYSGGIAAKSRECFQKAAELDPELPHPHYYLANFYRQDNDLPAAISELQQVERFFPDYRSIYSVLGVAYTCIGDYDKARKSLSIALRKDPGDELALRTSQSLRTMGKF